MGSKMNDSVRSEYRIETAGVALMLAEQPKAIRHRASRQVAERKSHDIVVRATDGGVGELMADWFFDLRRGRLRLYGGLLRFIDVSILRNVPRSVLHLIPDFIREYIDTEYEDHEAAALRRQRAA
jgi:hypothetical protein